MFHTWERLGRLTPAAGPGVLQRRTASSFVPSTVPAVVDDVLRSPGEPLSTASRALMESRFGRDFSQVRVHTDDRAAESAQAVSARAYTAGRRIVFGAGEYAPETASGRMLLAHELTHVVQQGASTAMPTRIGAPGDAAEQEAQRAAQAVTIGSGPTSGVLPSAPILQRDEIPELKLKMPELEAPKLARPSLFPPGQALQLSLGLDEDLLRMRGVTGVKPRPNLFPSLKDQPDKPDPLGPRLPSAQTPADPDKKEKLGELWSLSFELDIKKDSALGQALARQKREKSFITALSGKKAESSPLGLDLLNTGINILGELPPLRGAREKLHSLLRVENITVVADGEVFGALVEFKFGGRK